MKCHKKLLFPHPVRKTPRTKDTREIRSLFYSAVGNPAAFHALKPPAMERTFL
jgi:hypothetical protein